MVDGLNWRPAARHGDRLAAAGAVGTGGETRQWLLTPIYGPECRLWLSKAR